LEINLVSPKGSEPICQTRTADADSRQTPRVRDAANRSVFRRDGHQISGIPNEPRDRRATLPRRVAEAHDSFAESGLDFLPRLFDFSSSRFDFQKVEHEMIA
jgi:hypothetical protein